MFFNDDNRTFADYRNLNEATVYLSKIRRGGGSVWHESIVKGYLEDFLIRLKIYKEVIEEEKLDTGYYLAQSWHCWFDSYNAL